jgi:hypothetical protein
MLNLLEELPTPSRVGTTKVGGIDLNKPRMRWAVEAVIALCLSLSPHGFTASELARQVRVLSNQGESEYGARRAAYDLKKLRGTGSKCASAQLRIWISTVRDERSEAYPCGPKPLRSFTNGENVSQEAAGRRFSPACVVMY